MSDTKQITVLSLLQDIDAAMATMSQHNPNRRLLLRCSYGLIEMTHRARGMEQRADVSTDAAMPTPWAEVPAEVRAHYKAAFHNDVEGVPV